MSPHHRLSPLLAVVALGLVGLVLVGAWNHTQRTTPQEEAGLHYYVEASKLDPIFAIAGTDGDKLSAAVSTLLSQQTSIAKLYGGKRSSAIAESLYPRDFLLLLPQLQAARMQLLAKPSVSSAKKYHAALIKTIAAYQQDASRLATALDALTLPTIGYLGGNVVPKDFATKLRRVAALAAQQEEKENARFACFEAGTSTACASLESLRAARDAALATPTPLPEPSAEVHKADTLASRILALVPGSHLSDYSVTFPSHCMVEPTTYARAFYVHNRVGGPGRKLDIVNNLYFYDLANDPMPRPPFVSEELNAGITIQFQNMGNLYECPNSGLDTLELGRVIGVRDIIAQIQTQTPQEQALLAKDMLQKADLAPYVERMAASSTPQAQELVERYVEGSANFDQVVMGAYNDNLFLIGWDKSQFPVEFEFMMVVRNFASTLLLLGNPTFIPEPIDLFSTRTSNALHNLALREYRSDISKSISDEDIVKQVRASNAIVAKHFDTGQ